MSITIVSSLDVFCRQQACKALAADLPNAVVVLHDLLEDRLVIRRIFSDGQVAERHESTLEHGCLSCTVRLDVVPTVDRLLARGEQNIIVGLPPAVLSETAVRALHKGLTRQFTIDSVVLACAPDVAEDQIWDHHTLFESGYTPTPQDDRTAGEFLIGELSFNDTVLLSDPDLIPVDPDIRSRGAQLIHELAPHAKIGETGSSFRLGHHNYAQASARTAPGSVQVAKASSMPPFSTVVQRAERPLHPERFRRALGTLAQGCCWLRGQVWIAAAPERCIAIRGIGPRVWLENTGPWITDSPTVSDSAEVRHKWDPVFGDRGTILAATGEGMDATEIQRLLASCELTDAEMMAGKASFQDPFNLSSSH